MSIKSLKSLLQYPVLKGRFPRAKISLGTIIAGDSTLGSNISIERDCYILDSTIGDNVSIQSGSRLFRVSLEGNNILYPNCMLGDAQVGMYSYVNEGAIAARIRLGRFCSVGPFFICGLGEHPVNYVSTSPVFYSTLKQCGVSFADKDYFEERKAIEIGHDVWLGSRVFVRDGVRIGTGAVIAAGSVVVKDVPEYAIVGGVPAKLIRYRFTREVIEELLEMEWWNWSERKLREAQRFFVHEDIDQFLQWNRKGDLAGQQDAAMAEHVK